MKIKCEFCGTMMDDTQSVCPSCGAPNRNVRRSSGDQPLTIEELRQWYEGKGLPPEEVTRFFIGKDIREPKAFGIYYEEDTGNYVVYKNKASGERSVRYRGKPKRRPVPTVTVILTGTATTPGTAVIQTGTPIGKYIEKPLIFAENENQGLLCNTDYSFTVPSGLNRGRGSR